MVLADWWDRVAGRAGKREVFPSRFGEAAVYAMPAEDGSLVRMLNVGGVLQSATYLDERWATCPFAYLRSFDHLFEAALPEAPDPLVVNRVLMLGGAGFAYPKQLLLEHPGVALDVVEIDPAMVQIARERFFLDRLEMQLILAAPENISPEKGTTYKLVRKVVNNHEHVHVVGLRGFAPQLPETLPGTANAS